MEGHTVKNMHDDRESRLIVSFAVGCLVLALVLLVAFLVDNSDARPRGQHGDEPLSGRRRGRGPRDVLAVQQHGRQHPLREQRPRPKAPAAKAPAAPPRVRLTR
ncbi:hypothetical protein ACFU46_32160 [Streptomyces griseoincarnatus]